jgi:hypothetical protein
MAVVTSAADDQQPSVLDLIPGDLDLAALGT